MFPSKTRISLLLLAVARTAFGKQKVEVIHLEASDGSIKANFVNFGATLQSMWVKDKEGKFRDIVLGYDNITQYVTDGPTGQSHPYFGPVVGRYANRIKNGTFPIGNKKFHVAENENNGTDTLHGGDIGYDRRFWTVLLRAKDSVTFGHLDPDGFQGFPGSVVTTVRYTLRNGAKWEIKMGSVASKLTPIMLSSHVYWNFEAYQESDDLIGHFVEFNASKIVDTDGILIPTGKLRNIVNSPADFHEAKSLGLAIQDTKPGQFCGTNCSGFDNCWLYDDPHSKAVKFSVWSENSGIRLDILTDQIALQVYTCNGVASPVEIPRKQAHGGSSKTYGDHTCIVIEQQSIIDAINNPSYGVNQIYGPVRPYEWQATYQFTTL